MNHDRQETVLDAARERGMRRPPSDVPHVTSPLDVLHDVSNAMTAARLYVEVIEHCVSTETCQASDIRKALQVIKCNLAHATTLLAWGGHPIPATSSDLIALAYRAVAQVPPERVRDVSIRWSDGDVPMGEWDPVAVTRILANLLDNAAKYSFPGTPIVIEIVRHESSVEIAVRDRGGGVAESDLEVIFDGHRTEWARAMADGHGRGLQSSRRLAESLGGRLWATREDFGGLSMHLQLPLQSCRRSISPR